MRPHGVLGQGAGRSEPEQALENPTAALLPLDAPSEFPKPKAVEDQVEHAEMHQRRRPEAPEVPRFQRGGKGGKGNEITVGHDGHDQEGAQHGADGLCRVPEEGIEQKAQRAQGHGDRGSLKRAAHRAPKPRGPKPRATHGRAPPLDAGGPEPPNPVRRGLIGNG